MSSRHPVVNFAPASDNGKTQNTLLVLSMGFLFAVGLADANPVKEGKKGSAVSAQQLLGQYGLDWNKGPGEYKCVKVESGSKLFAEVSEAKCEFL